MSRGQVLLRAWMERQRLSYREAAPLLGVHWTFLHQLLSRNYRHRSPGLGTALKIQGATKIPVEAWMPTRVDAQRKPKRLRRTHVTVDK